jgi:thioredoxin-related protein
MKFLIALSLILLSAAGNAQTDTTTAPYKRFPEVPQIQLLLSDSTTKFTKAQLPSKKPVLFMLFSPECSHCQHETEELIAHKDELKDIQIVMVTLHPLWMMNEFIDHYKLKELPNVVVGRDIYYFFPSFYRIRNLPFLAMYDKKGNLITTFEGSMPMAKLVETFKGE